MRLGFFFPFFHFGFLLFHLFFARLLGGFAGFGLFLALLFFGEPSFLFFFAAGTVRDIALAVAGNSPLDHVFFDPRGSAHPISLVLIPITVPSGLHSPAS